MAVLKAAAEREEPTLAPIAETAAMQPADPAPNGALEAAGAPSQDRSRAVILLLVLKSPALVRASPAMAMACTAGGAPQACRCSPTNPGT